MRKSVLFIALFVLISLVSCKTKYELLLESGDVDLKYRTAMEFFQKKKYSKASSLFESIKLAVKNTEQEDSVEFYNALSHYRIGDMYTAETNFDAFINSYPMSSFYSNARFLYINCLYEETYRYELDQDPTYRALAAIQQYLVENPEEKYKDKCEKMLKELEERLDKKAYMSAKLYYDMQDYKAARYSFKNILKEDAETVYREDVVRYIVLSSYYFAHNSVKAKQKERYLVFVDDYLNFISEYPESEHRGEIEELYKKAQNKLSKLN